MANEHPWMPLYVVDWLEDREVKRMPRVARSMYLDILCHEWIGGPFEDDVRSVADMIGELPRSLAPHWAAIRQRFVVLSGSRLGHPKLESLREEARKKSEKAAKAAQERWSRDANAVPPLIAQAMRSESDQSQSTAEETEVKAPAQAQSVPKPKKAQQPKATRQRWSEVTAAYSDAWKALHSLDGRTPVIDRPDIAALARVYDTEGVDETIALVKRFVSDTDQFIARRGHILRDLPSRVNAYRSKQPTGLGHAPVSRFSESGDMTHLLRKKA